MTPAESILSKQRRLRKPRSTSTRSISGRSKSATPTRTVHAIDEHTDRGSNAALSRRCQRPRLRSRIGRRDWSWPTLSDGTSGLEIIEIENLGFRGLDAFINHRNGRPERPWSVCPELRRRDRSRSAATAVIRRLLPAQWRQSGASQWPQSPTPRPKCGFRFDAQGRVKWSWTISVFSLGCLNFKFGRKPRDSRQRIGNGIAQD